MSTDRYTKTILTIIAGCLLWLCLDGPIALTPVQAQSSESRVLLSGWIDFSGNVHRFNYEPLPVAQKR
jgi:hypothetical protein